MIDSNIALITINHLNNDKNIVSLILLTEYIILTELFKYKLI